MIYYIEIKEFFDSIFMKTITLAFFLLTIFSCQKFDKNTIAIDFNNSLSKDIEVDIVNVLPLNVTDDKGYLASSRILIKDSILFILNSYENQLSIFDLKANQNTSNVYTPEIDNIYAIDVDVQGDSIYILDKDKSKVHIYLEGKHVKDQQLSFWADNFQIAKDGKFLFYQGFVNEDLGARYHIFETDQYFNVLKRYFPVDSNDFTLVDRFGRFRYKIFRSDGVIYMLDDFKPIIYKYPDFSKPFYSFDFKDSKLSIQDSVISSTTLLHSFFETESFKLLKVTRGGDFWTVILNNDNKSIAEYSSNDTADKFILSNTLTVTGNKFVSLVSGESLQNIKTQLPNDMKIPTSIDTEKVYAIFYEIKRAISQ